MVNFTIPYPKKKAKFCKQYGLNAIYAGKHWTKRQADKDYWHLLVLQCLREQKIPQKVFTTPVAITFYWNDGLDIDNHAYMAKLIIDSVRGYLLTDDDKRYVVEVMHRFHGDGTILIEMSE